MNHLQRRLGRLEQGRRKPSPFDAMDPILAALSMEELQALGAYERARKQGRESSPEAVLVYGLVRERLAAVGIPLP